MNTVAKSLTKGLLSRVTGSNCSSFKTIKTGGVLMSQNISHGFSSPTTTTTRLSFSSSTTSSSSERKDINVDEVAYGFMASQALFSALEIELFDKIAESENKQLSISELNELVGISAPRLQTLVTALCGMNSLQRDEVSGSYSLSPNTSKFLVQSSRQYYGDYLRYQIGRQFYGRMGGLTEALTTGNAPSYAEWFSDSTTAHTYTKAQHNGSTATAKGLVKVLPFLKDEQKVQKLLDVGGGSGAFSYVLVDANSSLHSTILELPEVIASGEKIKAEQTESVQERVSFTELDVNKKAWPTPLNEFDVVLMSYISGSVPEPVIANLYTQAYQSLKSGGKLIVHDFMVDDSLTGPPIAALWALQHVCVNAEGLGLSPNQVVKRAIEGGFDPTNCEVMEMIKGLTKVVVATK